MSEYYLYNDRIPRVTAFKIVGDFAIKVTFDDNMERVIDFEPILIGPIFGPLRDTDLFRQVQLDRDFGTLEWPNGADIDPIVLHDWPQHVDAIVEQRRSQFAVPACYALA